MDMQWTSGLFYLPQKQGRYFIGSMSAWRLESAFQKFEWPLPRRLNIYIGPYIYLSLEATWNNLPASFPGKRQRGSCGGGLCLLRGEAAISLRQFVLLPCNQSTWLSLFGLEKPRLSDGRRRRNKSPPSLAEQVGLHRALSLICIADEPAWYSSPH